MSIDFTAIFPELKTLTVHLMRMERDSRPQFFSLAPSRGKCCWVTFNCYPGSCSKSQHGGIFTAANGRLCDPTQANKFLNRFPFRLPSWFIMKTRKILPAKVSPSSSRRVQKLLRRCLIFGQKISFQTRRLQNANRNHQQKLIESWRFILDLTALPRVQMLSLSMK